MPWTMFSARPATSAAARALTCDPHLSDAALAERCGCSTTTIGLVRAKLVSIGAIPAIPVADRIARPRPQQPSATRDAIERLGPDANPAPGRGRGWHLLRSRVAGAAQGQPGAG